MKSKPVVASILAVVGLLGTMTFRVVAKHHARNGAPVVVAPAAPMDPNNPRREEAPAPRPAGDTASPSVLPGALPQPPAASVAENAAYLDQYYRLDAQSHLDQDARGIPLTRRETAAAAPDFAHEGDAKTLPEQTPSIVGVAPLRASSRLQGHPPAATVSGATASITSLPEKTPRSGKVDGLLPAQVAPAMTTAGAPSARPRPQRFNPYGSVLKCELVFPLDSVNEQMPLVGIVMEPVYNNARLVIPAGAELHGTARPDRTRNRIFSGQDWVLVFPREHGRVNGRQLSVRGVALERAEPDINGMTWGMSDGSYGIEGTVIRTMNDQEIKRFVATFLAAAAAGVQTKQGNANGGETTQSTPRNAVLQGLSADMQQVASDIAAEIAQHGVFIHIPAGHQFYFYPTQIIDADAADISSDIATVK